MIVGTGAVQIATGTVSLKPYTTLIADRIVITATGAVVITLAVVIIVVIPWYRYVTDTVNPIFAVLIAKVCTVVKGNTGTVQLFTGKGCQDLVQGLGNEPNGTERVHVVKDHGVNGFGGHLFGINTMNNGASLVPVGRRCSKAQPGLT
jgi:hypothetical protein